MDVPNLKGKLFKYIGSNADRTDHVYKIKDHVMVKNPSTRQWEPGLVYFSLTLNDGNNYVRTTADFMKSFLGVTCRHMDIVFDGNGQFCRQCQSSVTL